MPIDIVLNIVEYLDLSSSDMKTIGQGLLEYEAETKRLLEERDSYYIDLLRGFKTNMAFIPETHKSYAVYKAAASTWGYILQVTPEKYLDVDLCLTAVKNRGSALRFVPTKLRSLEMCLIAVRNDWSSIDYVPEHFVSYLQMVY